MNVDGTTLVVLLLLVAASVALLVAFDRRRAAEPQQPADPSADRPPIQRTHRVRDVLVVAVWFGLATGVLHLLLAFVNRFGRDHFLMVGPQMLWMAPLSYVLIFAGLGGVLAVVAVISPRLVPLRFFVAGFAWVGLFALLLPFSQLHGLAAAALAAGVASQVARIMTRRAAHWLAIVGKSVLPVAGVIVLLALGLSGWRAAAEPLALRRLPVATAGSPNVLLLVLDTVRAANLSLYGYGRPTTPELARWAEEGTTFDLAFSTAPWTLKSHATMFTGLYPSQIGGDFEQPVRTDAPMLAEIFRDRGYVTGGFVANLLYASRESGLSRGFIRYDDYHASVRQVLLHSWIAHTPLFRGLIHSRSPADVIETLRHPGLRFESNGFNNRTYERRSAQEINAAFLDWQAAAGGRSFFAFLNYFDAHEPYRAPALIAARFALAEQSWMGTYDGAIAGIDQEIGRLLDELRRRGVLDNTIIIITSDHGEQFGEHGLTGHANSLYLSLLHVPLLIRYPARVAGHTRVAAPVTLRDLAATVIDLAGLSRQVRLPGTSFAATTGDAGSARDGSAMVAEVERAIRPEPNTPVRFGPMRSLLDERFHYIRRGDGFEELFDYRADPSELRNLGATAEGQREIVRLRARLASLSVR